VSPQTLLDWVSELGGQLVSISPAQDLAAVLIDRVCSVEKPHCNGVAALLSPRYRAAARRFDGGALLVHAPFGNGRSVQWVVDDPERVWSTLLERLAPPPEPSFSGQSPQVFVAPSAFVDPTAVLAPGVFVGPHVRVLERTVLHPNSVLYAHSLIGPDCVIGAGAVVGPGCTLGARVHLGPNAVVGDQGFGYGLQDRVRVRHIGGVILGDDVHLGACACVDAGTLDPTVVGAGTKIDNLVHLAHNVTVGEGAWILAQSGVAGSSSLGDAVVLAGQVGVAGHLSIGARTQVAAKSGVAHSVGDDQAIAGTPAFDLVRWRRVSTLLKDLEQMQNRLEVLEAQLAHQRALGKADDV